MQHTQLLSARKDNAAVAGGRRACLVAGLTPCSESVSCRPSAGMGGTCEGDAAVGLDLLLVSETSWHLSWRPSLPRTRSTTPTPRDYSCKSEKNKTKHIFILLSICRKTSGTARAVRTEFSAPTPDAPLLAPRATERFLRPVKAAGCAQGSKIQEIPGQISGGSYFVKGHEELKKKTLKIFGNVNYRLCKLNRLSKCSLKDFFLQDVTSHSFKRPLKCMIYYNRWHINVTGVKLVVVEWERQHRQQFVIIR